jgi:hypothetical protein
MVLPTWRADQDADNFLPSELVNMEALRKNGPNMDVFLTDPSPDEDLWTLSVSLELLTTSSVVFNRDAGIETRLDIFSSLIKYFY